MAATAGAGGYPPPAHPFPGPRTRGNQRISVGGGPRVYVARNGTGPDWGLRVVATLLFPK